MSASVAAAGVAGGADSIAAALVRFFEVARASRARQGNYHWGLPGSRGLGLAALGSLLKRFSQCLWRMLVLKETQPSSRRIVSALIWRKMRGRLRASQSSSSFLDASCNFRF